MKRKDLLQAPSSRPRTPGQRLLWYRLRQGLSQEALAEAIGASTRSLRRWEQDLAIPHGISRERLCHLFGIELHDLFGASSLDEEKQDPAPVSPWTVPFPRNPCFTGRETILQTLHSLLGANEQTIALTQASAISGLGGIGKTQVAIEYAYRFAQEYTAVFWLAAETAESLMGSLQSVAEELSLPVRQSADQSQMTTAVQHWLASHSGWLLIADNVEDLDLLQGMLPSRRQGSLLLTTRRQALGTLALPLELPSMSHEEGITFILRRAHQLDLFSSKLPSSAAEPRPLASAFPAVAELVTLLEGLPLALDQAGAYLEETGCSLADYLDRYRHQRQRLLARRGIHQGAHPASVAATLKLSVERVEHELPAATELLRFCAFLHAEAIPEELLLSGASFLGAALEPLLTDVYQFDMALSALRSASLIARSPETRTLSIHRLVQALLRDWMAPAEAERRRAGVVRTVNAAFPEETPETAALCERFLPQALACIPLIEQATNLQSEGSELLYKAGQYLVKHGRYAEAEVPLAHALTLSDHLPDLDPLQMVERLEAQAALFWKQGKYAATEALLLRSVAFEQAHIPSTHLCVSETLNNLALLYWYQGKYAQAESLYEQVLQMKELLFGPDDHTFAISLDNRALLHQERGQYEQAEPLHLRALAIIERKVGHDHFNAASTLNNLTLLYLRQGKYELAHSFGLRTLHIQEEHLGQNHPELAIILINLANIYQQLEQYELAEQEALRALQIQERSLDADHPEFAIILNRLGVIYSCQRKYRQAEPLYQRALQIRERHLGQNHPKVAVILTELATLYREQARHEQAELLYQRAIAINEEHLGAQHPQTAMALYQLACSYYQRGQLEQALPLYQRAFTIYEQQLGQEHPNTLKAREQYALLCAEVGEKYQDENSTSLCE